MTKTLLVGFDAACWEYISPWLNTGGMPNLKQLMDGGSSGIMHSTMPPWTPTAWSSIITGKNPGKHGIFDMVSRRPGSYEFLPINATNRNGTPFWKHLNHHGVRTGLVNIPFTYPPDSPDGFVVCGFGTPKAVSDFAHPPEVLQWIKKDLGNYQPEVDSEVLRTAQPVKILEAEKRHQATLVRIAGELASECQVDILMINLMLPDHANHKMPDIELVKAAYRQTDEDLGKLIRSFRPDNVLVISDHGSSRLKGDFLLNLWLQDQGYLVTIDNTSSERKDILNWLLLQWLRDHRGWDGHLEKVTRRILKDSFFSLPRRIRNELWKRIEAYYPYAEERVLKSDQLDWTRTQVFPGSSYSGLLYFNLRNREDHGIVPVEERRNLAAEISSKLIDIQDPISGKPLFENVYIAEDLYSGSAVDHAPDLILDAYSSGWNIRTSKYASASGAVVQRYFIKADNRHDFGWHSREGIFVFSGIGFAKSEGTIEGHLEDIPATILHLYDVPVPEEYDGRALIEVMAPEIRARPVQYQPATEKDFQKNEQAYTLEESEALIEHLRALGYLD